MTQPSPQPQPQPQPQTQPQPPSFAPMPIFSAFSSYIQAAASGSRDSLFHLFVVVCISARATVRCLILHYQSHPHALKPGTLARIQYCAARLKAIFYTIHHAPERFLAPAQLRALTRARAVLAHILQQPVDFSPLAPLLASPGACPPPPRSVGVPASCRHEPCYTPSSALRNSEVASPLPAVTDASLHTPHSALRTSPSDPLLLRSPGCALGLRPAPARRDLRRSCLSRAGPPAELPRSYPGRVPTCRIATDYLKFHIQPFIRHTAN